MLPGREPQLAPAPPFGRAIPVCEPDLSGSELERVTDCMRSGWISSIGALVTEFEQAFAAAVGARHGVACCNGTVAVHMALHTAGVGPGDEVIVPSFTMIATANAVRYCGAVPVLVDSDPLTWNLSLQDVAAKITDRTRAIVPVHTYGNPCDLDALRDLAAEHDLALIYDAAEAHGALYQGQPIGGAGLASTYSFYANKIVTTGEGGMVTTDDAEFAKVAREVANHAFSEERHFWHRYLGFNYRLTSLQAAIGLAQVERFDSLVQARIGHGEQYSELLRDVSGVQLPPTSPGNLNVYWMYGIMLEDAFPMSRDELREFLAARGVETRTFFVPVHLQPVYFGTPGAQGEFPVAEDLCLRGLYLPSSSGLRDDELRYVVDCIRQASENA